jgi:hypothetical protein
VFFLFRRQANIPQGYGCNAQYWEKYYGWGGRFLINERNNDNIHYFKYIVVKTVDELLK